MEAHLLTSWTQYGLVGIMIGAILIILWRILIWVMRWVDKQEETHREERKSWQDYMSNFQQVQSRIMQTIPKRYTELLTHRS